VRAWQPGDRLVGPAGPRRVTRWLADAGIPGPLREGWPVVAAGANVWWIPGVRQAELPPGAPYLSYDCDRQPD
jgi:tRNA(Ile)-lysidine synthetase-like protein